MLLEKVNDGDDKKTMIGIVGCRRDNGRRRENFRGKKCPNESQKVWDPLFIGDQNPRDPKIQVVRKRTLKRHIA